ncbi:hypothetical protein ETB97_007194 [Aspergillus alliaceus]|uniref:Uncharacterized protein n=1 Tax=Petromyces alliaceus TaxID=209559 RepID=A0A8H6ACR0_PETAA|nr:hypothetical protein ETB97_007194 [Aspergillus burnettii]
MKVYGEQAMYDDPFSYCDTRCVRSPDSGKGFRNCSPSPKLWLRRSRRRLSTSWCGRQRQRYTFAGIHVAKSADSLISLTLEGNEPNEKVLYHKDMWNSRDCSHDGLEARIKKLNG